jgi:hypothetical protein
MCVLRPVVAKLPIGLFVGEELEREQRERYDPSWQPRALLNGAGAFGSKVQARMLPLWEKQRKGD